jgi:hypothetical protein
VRALRKLEVLAMLDALLDLARLCLLLLAPILRNSPERSHVLWGHDLVLGAGEHEDRGADRYERQPGLRVPFLMA